MACIFTSYVFLVPCRGWISFDNSESSARNEELYLCTKVIYLTLSPITTSTIIDFGDAGHLGILWQVNGESGVLFSRLCYINFYRQYGRLY